MRFKKGDVVEVLSNREAPSGAWRTAEIISGNGHYYTIRYGSHVGVGADKERVPRKIIRPLPPAVGVAERWAPGDIVEVLESSSWKMAVISKVLERNCFLVRLLGSSLELRVTQFDIRVRQSWHNDEWIMIGQGSKGGNEGQQNQTLSMKCKAKLSSPSHVRNLREKLNPEGDTFSLESKDDLDDFNSLSSRALKRRRYSLVEPHCRAAQGIRAVEKEGRRTLRPLAAHRSKLLEQVDDILSLGKKEHERCNFGSAKYQNGSCLDVDARKRKDIGTSRCLLARGVEEESVSVASSVGSSSIGTNVFVPIEGNDESTTSDAESFCGSESRRRKIVRPGKRSAAELHMLELEAYRCTIERLHACGPITWEQEAWITNLRLSLNISNDEHLMQIRNLVSADNSTACR